MVKKKMNKMTMAFIIMAVLLVGALGYVGYDIYSEAQNTKMMGIYQEGAAYGYELAFSEVYKQSLTCQPLPLTFNNQTVSLIATECLQQQQQQQ